MAVDVSVRVAQLIKHKGMKIKWYWCLWVKILWI